MSVPWPATTGRCRILPTTTRCYRPRVRGTHDGQASGPSHPAALQGTAHADDRHAVRPPGGRSGPRRPIPCRLSRGTAGGRDGGGGRPAPPAKKKKQREDEEGGGGGCWFFSPPGAGAANLSPLAPGDYVSRAE